MLLIYISLGLIIIFGLFAIVSFLDFKMRAKRLPEACEYDDLHARKARLSDEHQELQEAADEARGLIDRGKDARSILDRKEEILLIEGEIKKLEGIRSEYELTYDKLDKATQEYNAKQSQLLPLENRHKELSTKNDELQNQSTGFKEANRELELKNDKLQKEQNGLELTMATLSEQFTLLKQEQLEMNSECNKLRVDIASEKGRLEGLQNETIRLSDQKLSFEAEIQILITDKAELKDSYTKLKQDVTIIETQLNGLLIDKQDLSNSIDKITQDLSEIEEEHRIKKSELSRYETERDALQDQISMLKELANQSRKDIEKHGDQKDKENPLKDLWAPVIYPPLIGNKENISELKALDYTARYIAGQKLIFPQRILYAFHTAMKCNDISPMAVLAGISGTGKSELPRCYAEGMGMHFTMLAVQPRWDSPQDLLGFYNYMEHKYKATEFARAMIRFDQYNRSDWGTIPPECDDRSDRMLMVLFDEMNLARVEYYFSEFLSKLETRRGVDLSDPHSRIKAAIELEIGGHTPMSIFPGRNILFTGTMNEDESTQTLSDKVLDRANVLRFGKPGDATKKSEVEEISKPGYGLLYSNWQKWVTDYLDVEENKEINEWISDLNNTMNLINKPFGHRVAYSINAYVENYPDQSDLGRKLALADQMEQRILPKLRGIDLENLQALNQISKLIDFTNDESLLKAFNDAKEDSRNHGIFMWQGVDRSEKS